jgi:hypothetical protein
MKNLHPAHKGELGVTFNQISLKELSEIKKKSVKKWHWERTEGGVKPVADEEIV